MRVCACNLVAFPVSGSVGRSGGADDDDESFDYTLIVAAIAAKACLSEYQPGICLRA